MKKIINIFIITVITAQSAFGWDAVDMMNSIDGSIRGASKPPSPVETQIFPGSDIGLTIFALCLIFCPPAAAGVGKGSYEVGKEYIKAVDKLNDAMDSLCRHGKCNWFGGLRWGTDDTKHLSAIQADIFAELDVVELRQTHGIAKVQKAADKSANEIRFNKVRDALDSFFRNEKRKRSMRHGINGAKRVSAIQAAVFSEPDFVKLKQMYGVVRVQKTGNKGINVPRITKTLSTAKIKLNMRGIMNNVRAGGFRR